MLRTIAAGAVLLGLSACGESFSPSIDTVTGTYTATTLASTTGGVRTDLLAGGATLSITLASNGTTIGQLFVPNAGENGEDLTASLAGTWSLSGDRVTFTESADTFIRDMTFTATEDQLEGDETFSDTRIEVTLALTGPPRI